MYRHRERRTAYLRPACAAVAPLRNGFRCSRESESEFCRAQLERVGASEQRRASGESECPSQKESRKRSPIPWGGVARGVLKQFPNGKIDESKERTVKEPPHHQKR